MQSVVGGRPMQTEGGVWKHENVIVWQVAGEWTQGLICLCYDVIKMKL